MTTVFSEDNNLQALVRPNSLAPLPVGFPALLSEGDLDGAGSGLYVGWYLGDSQQCSSDHAKDAYEKARDALTDTLGADDKRIPWLNSHNSMQDVQKAVIDALGEYKARSRGSKLQEWLRSCSARVQYYGAVFDTFSNHHPEYVSLAWGALKFLFMSVLNHEELLTEISKAVSSLADVLPRTELHLILYPTARMQEAVSLLYARVIDFIVEAIRWCRKGKARHALAALSHPFELKFKAIIDEITAASRRVDQLANAASKAEIRHLNVKVHEMTKNVLQLTEMIAVQQKQQTLHTQTLLSLRLEQQQMFQKGNIEEIRNTMLLLEDTPDPAESLAYCRSMRTRRRRRLPTQVPVRALANLKTWISDQDSSLILAQGQGVKTSSLDFAVDFLDVVLEQGYPVMWALPSDNTSGKETPSVIAILRSLISQILELNLEQGGGPSPQQLSMKNFKSAVGIEQWFDLLEQCVSALPRAFIIIDTAVVEASISSGYNSDEYFTLDDFVDRIKVLVDRRGKGGLKVVIISWQFRAVVDADPSDIFDEMQMFTDMGRRAQRLMRQPKYRGTFRRRNHVLQERLQSSLS